MADDPSSKPKDQNKEPPAPEVLKPKADTDSAAEESSSSQSVASKPKAGKHTRRTYRPSHKGTFIGLAVVVAILAINSIGIAFVVRHQAKDSQIDPGQVSINQSALDKLGVKRSSVGDQGVELTVNPDARFNGKVRVGGDVSIGGQLVLSKKFSAADASLAQLQAGNTSLNQLNVNGDGTLTNLNVRKDLAVAGSSRLQGAATFSNNVSVAGNISVGGQLSVNTLHIRNLVADSIIQIGGHLITTGVTPGVSGGACGHASISGNDAAGTVFVGGCGGSGSKTVATVRFRSAYSGYPHVVVTPICSGVTAYLTNVSSSGFSIGTTGSMGGCQFNYIVMQ